MINSKTKPVLKSPGKFFFREYGSGKGLKEIAGIFRGRLVRARDPSFYTQGLQSARFRNVLLNEFDVKREYSFEEVFKDSFKSKVFRKEYNEEVVRLKLANQVRDMRMSKHLTQKKVAERADMPQSVVARVESGSHSFSLGTINRIAQVFEKELQLA